MLTDDQIADTGFDAGVALGERLQGNKLGKIDPYTMLMFWRPDDNLATIAELADLPVVDLAGAANLEHIENSEFARAWADGLSDIVFDS